MQGRRPELRRFDGGCPKSPAQWRGISSLSAGIASLVIRLLRHQCAGKLYHAEVGTARVVEIAEAGGAQLRISRLTVVELRSVFAIKARTRVVTREDVDLLLRQFQEDVVSRKFQVFAVNGVRVSGAFDRKVRLR